MIFEVTGESIKLGQLIKLAGLAETGGDAKEAIENGRVTVDGEVETRRGRQLFGGEVVRLGRESVTVETGLVEEEDDFDPEKWR